MPGLAILAYLPTFNPRQHSVVGNSNTIVPTPSNLLTYRLSVCTPFQSRSTARKVGLHSDPSSCEQPSKCVDSFQCEKIETDPPLQTFRDPNPDLLGWPDGRGEREDSPKRNRGVHSQTGGRAGRVSHLCPQQPSSVWRFLGLCVLRIRW